jgi:hypothetical protein
MVLEFPLAHRGKHGHKVATTLSRKEWCHPKAAPRQCRSSRQGFLLKKTHPKPSNDPMHRKPCKVETSPPLNLSPATMHHYGQEAAIVVSPKLPSRGLQEECEWEHESRPAVPRRRGREQPPPLKVAVERTRQQGTPFPVRSGRAQRARKAPVEAHQSQEGPVGSRLAHKAGCHAATGRPPSSPCPASRFCRFCLQEAPKITQAHGPPKPIWTP